MSSVEPEARDFLRKIAWSVFYGIVWLMINMTLGIYFGLMIPEGHISLVNILYYLFFIVSLAGLIRYYYNIWKQKYPHG